MSVGGKVPEYYDGKKEGNKMNENKKQEGTVSNRWKRFRVFIPSLIFIACFPAYFFVRYTHVNTRYHHLEIVSDDSRKPGNPAGLSENYKKWIKEKRLSKQRLCCQREAYLDALITSVYVLLVSLVAAAAACFFLPLFLMIQILGLGYAFVLF